MKRSYLDPSVRGKRIFLILLIWFFVSVCCLCLSEIFLEGSTSKSRLQTIIIFLLEREIKVVYVHLIKVKLFSCVIREWEQFWRVWKARIKKIFYLTTNVDLIVKVFSKNNLENAVEVWKDYWTPGLLRWKKARKGGKIYRRIKIYDKEMEKYVIEWKSMTEL